MKCTRRADADNNIWIGTDGAGLNGFDPLTHNFKNYWNNKSSNNTIYSDYVLSVSEYLPGVVALSFHHGGVDLLDVEKQLFTYFVPGGINAGKLTSPGVNMVYKDRRNDFWAGINDNGGIHLLDNKTKKGLPVFSRKTKRTKAIAAARYS